LEEVEEGVDLFVGKMAARRVTKIVKSGVLQKVSVDVDRIVVQS